MSALKFFTHTDAAPSFQIETGEESFIREDPKIKAVGTNVVFLGNYYAVADNVFTIDGTPVTGSAKQIATAISALFKKANSSSGGSAVTFDNTVNKLRATGTDGTVYYFSPSSSVEPLAQAYFDRMAAAATPLNTTEKNSYNAFIGTAKAKTYFSKLKATYIYWGGDAGAKLNTLANTFNQIWSNIVYARFATHGNGSTAFARTGFIPSVEVPGNNYSFGSWGIDNSNTGTVIEIGSKNGASEAWVAPEIAGNLYCQCFSSAASPSGPAMTDPTGLVSISRTSATDCRAYRNGSQVGINASSETVGPPNAEVYIWGQNNNGALVGPSPFNHRFDYMATGLTPSEMADFYADLNTMFTAAG